MRFGADEVAAATGGRRQGPPAVVDGAAIDSRGEVAGRLFVPIVAARDGHDFIDEALAKGAAAYLTTGRFPAGTAIVVDDTTAALRSLAGAARDRLPDRVVGVTGSVGKTTVKDLLAAVLGRRLATVATVENRNNELGLPLTLLDAPDGCEAAVLEMGARRVGNIRDLCEVARPTVGVVTAVGPVHLEVFGTIDDVAAGKAELVEALPASGTAVLNADDQRVAAMRRRTAAAVVRYGLAGDVDVTAERIELDDELRAAFRLRTPHGAAEIRLEVRGEHQVSNSLAAAAAALAVGATLEDVARGLAHVVPSRWRMELHRLPGGARLLNDSYNASPPSMLAGLRSLARLGGGRRIAVLGTMAELGEGAEAAHREVAAAAAELGLELVAVDETRYGVPVTAIEEIPAVLAGLGPGDAVLLKGSRVAGLERVAEQLIGQR